MCSRSALGRRLVQTNHPWLFQSRGSTAHSCMAGSSFVLASMLVWRRFAVPSSIGGIFTIFVERFGRARGRLALIGTSPG